jgi:hypothetical protein
MPGNVPDSEIDRVLRALPGYVLRKIAAGVAYGMLIVALALFYGTFLGLFWAAASPPVARFWQGRGWYGDTGVLKPLMAYAATWIVFAVIALPLAWVVGQLVWSLGARVLDPEERRVLTGENLFGYADTMGQYKPRWFSTRSGRQRHRAEVEAKREESRKRWEAEARKRRVHELLFGADLIEQWEVEEKFRRGDRAVVGQTVASRLGEQAAFDLLQLLTLDGLELAAYKARLGIVSDDQTEIDDRTRFQKTVQVSAGGPTLAELGKCLNDLSMESEGRETLIVGLRAFFAQRPAPPVLPS